MIGEEDWLVRSDVRLLAALVLGGSFAFARGPGPVPGGQVRVAAVQCYSRMGQVRHNRQLLAKLIGQAAGRGAKIVVLPECAVQGYMDPGRDRVWSAKADEEGELAVQAAAECVPGPSTHYFAQVAKRCGVYLAVPLIEGSDGRFYNAQVLLGPDGKLLLHHRKTHLWPPGDGLWASPGKKPPQAVTTPYGRLGLMICYEVHRLPKALKEAQVDIVLYSVGWYGPNTEIWYTDIFPRRYVVPNGFAVVAANWSADRGAPGWEGHGYSCVIGRDGKVLAMARSTRGAELVLADVPIRHRALWPPGYPPADADPGQVRSAEARVLKHYVANTAPVDADNAFAAANPGYKERAGLLYEREYLDAAVLGLAKHADLSVYHVPAAKAILRMYIYERLDAHVRGNGAVAGKEQRRLLGLMDERFQAELDDNERHAKYLEWRKDASGAHNSLRFLMAAQPATP